MGFSLQGMAKRHAGSQVPDRDAQFRHINTTVEQFLAEDLPAVSVDAKKKEPIGDFARPVLQPEIFRMSDMSLLDA